MVAKNDITGDSIQSKVNSQAYQDNYDRIFGKKKRPADFQDVLSTEECVVQALEAEDRITRNNAETQAVKQMD